MPVSERVLPRLKRFEYPNIVVRSIASSPQLALIIMGTMEYCNQLHYVTKNLDLASGGVGTIGIHLIKSIDDSFEICQSLSG